MGKRVLAFGTFDGLHSGHLFFLRMARARGDALSVAVARDAHVRELKGKEPNQNDQERMRAVLELAYVDDALICDEQFGTFNVLEQIKPDVIVLGYDQDELATALEQWMVSHIRIPTVRLEKFEMDGCCVNCKCK